MLRQKAGYGTNISSNYAKRCEARISKSSLFPKYTLFWSPNPYLYENTAWSYYPGDLPHVRFRPGPVKYPAAELRGI